VDRGSGRLGTVVAPNGAVMTAPSDEVPPSVAMAGAPASEPASPESSSTVGSSREATPFPVARRSSPLAPAAGLVLFAYAVWWSGSLVAVVSHETFNAWQRAYAGLAGRMAIGVVLVAALHHTFEGALRIVAGESAAGAARAERLRPLAAFFTLALGLPAVLVVVWPAVRAWGT